MEDALSFVARQMGISRSRASELTGLANDAVAEVLDPEHPVDHSPERQAEVEAAVKEVDVNRIAENLHLQVSEFRTWAEDEMVFIEYGQNLADGIAAEGPTALSATADFYCRWYNMVMIKGQRVLLSDDEYHHFDERGEEQL